MKERKEIEAILTATAALARKTIGSALTGGFSMSDPEAVVFVVTGDQTVISPADLGAVMERIGKSLQGQHIADTKVVLENRSKSGNVEPLDVRKPFGPTREDAAADNVGEISGGALVELLRQADRGGRHRGQASAYADVLGDAHKRLIGQEEMLKAAKEGSHAASICMGEIMALRCLLDHFAGAEDHHNEKALDAVRSMRGLVEALGILESEELADAATAAASGQAGQA
jgi:hypothetical protein